MNEEIIRHYMNINKYEKALNEVEKLLVKNPENPYYLYLRADCLFRLNRCDEALVEMKSALEKGYSAELCIGLMGMMYWGLNNNGEAKDCFKEALRLNPNDAEVIAAYGVIQYTESSNIKKFGESIKDSLKIDPNNQVAMRCAFTYYLIKKDKTRMKNILERYLEHTGDEIGKLRMLGDYELHLRHYKKAREHYKQAFLLDPTNKAIHEEITKIDSESYILGIPMSEIKEYYMMFKGYCMIVFAILCIIIGVLFFISPIIGFIYKDYSLFKFLCVLVFFLGFIIRQNKQL